MHFLTFSLAMEASDQFAFSGPKLSKISLTPMSRRTVEYDLLLLDTASLLSISLESSSDLNSWIPVVGAQVQPGRVTFSNPLRTLSEKSHQFFRLRINP